MISLVMRNIFRMVFLIFFQVSILNDIQVGGFINPYLYVLFILMLPFETPKWLLIFSAFALGISVDLFSGTPGLHAAACVFMAFCRPGVQNMISSRQEYQPGIQPIIRDLGFKWFFTYSLILVTAHHIMLFYLEIFSFKEFFQTLYRTGLSVASTMFLVILSQYLIYRPKK